MLTPVSMQAGTTPNLPSKKNPSRIANTNQSKQVTTAPPRSNPASLVNIGKSMLFLLLGTSASLAGGSTSSTPHLKGSSLPSGTTNKDSLALELATTTNTINQAFITPKTQPKGITPQQIEETTNRFEELGNVITAALDGKVYSKTCGFSAQEISDAMNVLVTQANSHNNGDIFSRMVDIFVSDGGYIGACTTYKTDYTATDANDCATQSNNALRNEKVITRFVTATGVANAIQSYATNAGVVTIVTDGDECAITLSPTLQPSLSPTTTSPSQAPSTAPSYTTSEAPSSSPSTTPSLRPTGAPTIIKRDQSSNKNWEEKAEQFFKDNAPFIAGAGAGSLMTALIIAILR